MLCEALLGHYVGHFFSMAPIELFKVMIVHLSVVIYLDLNTMSGPVCNHVGQCRGPDDLEICPSVYEYSTIECRERPGDMLKYYHRRAA